MNETNISKLRFRARVTTLLALVVGVLIGVLAKDSILNACRSSKASGAVAKSDDYNIEELEVDYLKMLDGVKGVSFDVVNGIKCICKCDDAYPEGETVVYKFEGYIGDEVSKKTQKVQFNYTLRPFVANGQLSLSDGEVSRVLLEPEDVIVNRDGMKRLVEAFAIPKFKPLEQYAPNGAFAIKELYSKMVVIKISKEK